jgi:hypothetical protein
MLRIDLVELSRIIASFIGGVVITIIAHWFARQRQKEAQRKEILVFFDLKVRKGTWYTTDISEPDQDLVVISAVNNSPRPVTVIDAGFFLENGRSFSPAGVPLDWWEIPKKLDDGEIAQFFLKYSDLIDAMHEGNSKINSVWVCDATEKFYKSKIPDNLRKRIDQDL